MKRTRCWAAIATLALGTASHTASAATILFDFQALDPRNSVTFTIDSAAAPAAVDPNWFRYGITATQPGRTFTDTVRFHNTKWSGGFTFLSTPFYDLLGPQLFSGAISQPQFKVGNFTLKAMSGAAAGTLTISQVIVPAPSVPPIVPAILEPSTAVPEPDTWALLLIGFAAAGAMMRRRGPAVRSVRFSPHLPPSAI